MKKILNCIMLVDDNIHDNFFHEREINKNNKSTIVIAKKSGREALDYLKSTRDSNLMLPELIFLDINMPGMNGWKFLTEYELLDKDMHSRVMVVMLTTSDNPDDEAKARKYQFLTDYIIKPLTSEGIRTIIQKYFKS